MDRYRHALAVIVGMLVGVAIPWIFAWLLSNMDPEIRMRDHIFIIMIVSLAFGAVGVAVNLPNTMGTGESGYYGAMGSGSGRRRRPSGKRSEAKPEPPREEARAPGAADGGFTKPEPGAGDAGGAGGSGGSGEHIGGGQHIPRRPMKIALGRREALHVLGLDLTATNDQIRAAFRKLAKENHPDQFAHAGEDAVAEATRSFQRIHEAYKTLMG